VGTYGSVDAVCNQGGVNMLPAVKLGWQARDVGDGLRDGMV